MSVIINPSFSEIDVIPNLKIRHKKNYVFNLCPTFLPKVASLPGPFHRQ